MSWLKMSEEDRKQEGLPAPHPVTGSYQSPEILQRKIETLVACLLLIRFTLDSDPALWEIDLINEIDRVLEEINAKSPI